MSEYNGRMRRGDIGVVSYVDGRKGAMKTWKQGHTSSNDSFH